jgi:hypothetical protein
VADVINGVRLADSHVYDARLCSLSFSPDSRQLLALSDRARLCRWVLDDSGRFVSREMLADDGWVTGPVKVIT